MQRFDDLTKEKQVEIYNKAFTFLHDHADYVSNKLEKNTPAIAPSGSDMFHPELWKSIHWQWFLKTDFLDDALDF